MAFLFSAFSYLFGTNATSASIDNCYICHEKATNPISPSIILQEEFNPEKMPHK